MFAEGNVELSYQIYVLIFKGILSMLLKRSAAKKAKHRECVTFSIGLTKFRLQLHRLFYIT